MSKHGDLKKAEKLSRLETREWGQGSTAQLMFLIAGWPDTCEVFEDNIVAKFSASYRIVGMNLPGYTKATAKAAPLMGWSFDQIADLMFATMEGYVGTDKSGKRPVIVAHDWGAVVLSEFLLRYPKYFSKLVFLDVAPGTIHEGPETRSLTVSSILFGKSFAVPFKQAAFIVFYQWWLIFSYVLGLFSLTRKVGKLMMLYFAANGGAKRYARNPDVKTEKAFEGLHPGMNYPYVQLWMNVLKRSSITSDIFFREPLVPVLYLYGEKKPAAFHSKRWLQSLARRRDGSKAISYPGGHWFYANPTKPVGAQSLGDIAAFLGAK
jgi:pimeloyl-ACP methyl ester carboxylesterase